MNRNKLLIFITAVLLLVSPAFARADRSRFLDAALSMLEEGNPFLVRYNSENRADIQARFPLGCPYFWGGRRVSRILQPASPEQNSDYYRKDRTYLYGLDCAGLTQWVMTQVSLTKHDSISNLLNRTKYKEYLNYQASKHTGKKRARYLKPGDLGALQHADGSFHILMYIGTLVDFGYTKKTVPEELVPYLNYPLVIHCTESSDYYERYRLWLEETRQAGITPPCGGVIVSLLDVPPDAAPASTPDVEGLGRPCFLLEGYHLETLDLSGEKRERWIRWRQHPE